MQWLEDPVAAAIVLPPLVLPLFVFASAFLEYVFPPFWGDTFVLLGFFLAGQGAVPPLLIFAAAMAGSLGGAALAYALGRRYGLTILRRVVGRRHREGHRRMQRVFRRFGERVLIVNRFFPVVRGVLLYGAGALRLRFAATLVYTGVSSLAFTGFLMWVGLWTAGSWEQIVASFRRYNLLIGWGVVALVIIWVAARWRSRRAPAS